VTRTGKPFGAVPSKSLVMLSTKAPSPWHPISSQRFLAFPAGRRIAGLQQRRQIEHMIRVQVRDEDAPDPAVADAGCCQPGKGAGAEIEQQRLVPDLEQVSRRAPPRYRQRCAGSKQPSASILALSSSSPIWVRSDSALFPDQ